MQARKADVVTANVNGVAFLFRKNKVTWLKGAGRIVAPGKVDVDGTVHETKHIVIATGSDSVPLPGVEVDEKQIVTSTGGLELDKVPGHLVVIGGGYIGLELGSVWRRLGAQVTVVEFLDRIVPTMDGEVATAFQRLLTRQGMKFRLGTKVTGARTGNDGVTLTMEPAKGGAAETSRPTSSCCRSAGGHTRKVWVWKRQASHWTSATGSRPMRISPPTCRASTRSATSSPARCWRTKREDEGVALAEILAGQAGHVNYDVIPGVVYTWPEVASVGRTEEELKAAGVAYKVGKFPFTANGRARAMGDTDGFVKLLADKASDRLLGAHILGPDAGTLIAELALAMEFGASAEDVARTCHAHPTLEEAVKEAALAVDGRALHI